MKIFHLIYLSLLILLSSILSAQNVKISFDAASSQSAYGAGKLKQALIENGYEISDKHTGFIVTLLQDSKLKPESYKINKSGKYITVSGGDGTGIIYGALSICEDLRNAISLGNIKNKSESPYLQFRAIKFDLPWDTYRHSTALNLHSETCKDLRFWEAFLDMMAENRFNTLTLWNLHPYTFMIKPKNFPEASPFNDDELKVWKKLFAGIFKMARERGIDTYLVPFNIFVTPEFAKAHNVAMNNLEHNHYINGDTSEVIKQYTRECVTQVLQEYPDLTGMGLTLGEAMGGMTPQQREDWMRATIIEGMSLAGRKSKLIHRIPFSATTSSLSATSIEMEQITRKGIEKEASMDFIQAPVWADLKFNWSHAHSTTKLIKVHGGKLYGTYFNPVPDKYKIIWTARNEDFFCLRWGVPGFVREHILNNSQPYVGGYIVGSETYIPAKDYFTNPAITVDWKYAFQRQWLFYKIWGRLLYNPNTSEDAFRNEFVKRYGKKAGKLLDAFSLAGITPLKLASSYDCGWDFTLYSEGFMALNPDSKRVEYININSQINQPPLDTSFISIKDYVYLINSKTKIGKNKTTPLETAAVLEKDCRKALMLVEDINPGGNNPLMFEIADVKTWANLGLFYSEKIKGAVDLQTYRTTGKIEYKNSAVIHLENALKFWENVISITRPIYNDMPLVHLSEQDGKTWKENDHLRFHWQLLRPDVEKDIEIARNSISKL